MHTCLNVAYISMCVFFFFCFFPVCIVYVASMFAFACLLPMNRDEPRPKNNTPQPQLREHTPLDWWISLCMDLKCVFVWVHVCAREKDTVCAFWFCNSRHGVPQTKQRPPTISWIKHKEYNQIAFWVHNISQLDLNGLCGCGSLSNCIGQPNVSLCTGVGVIWSYCNSSWKTFWHGELIVRLCVSGVDKFQTWQVNFMAHLSANANNFHINK